MAKVFSILKDLNSVPCRGVGDAYELPDNGLSYGIDIAATTEQTLTVPANVDTVRIKKSNAGDFWCGVGSSSISLPAATFATINAELNPTRFSVTAGSTLRFISKAGCQINVIFGSSKNYF